MRKHNIKIVCLILSLTLLFSACNNKNDSNSKDGNNNINIELWHIWASDTETARKPLLSAIADYEKENPNVKIKVSAYQNETYKTKIQTAMAGNQIPDIFFSWGATWANTYIKSGKVMALDDVAKDVENQWKDNTRDNFISSDGKLYAFPMTMWAGILFCNKQLFKENNLEFPKTYDQLLTAVKTFKAKDITPIAIGAKERWTIAMQQNILSLRTAGIKKTKDALVGRESFDQKEFVDSTTKLQELVTEGAFGERASASSLSNDEAQNNFTMGKAAMRYSGSWEVGNIDAEKSCLRENVECLNFPSIVGSGDSNTFQGGAQDTFMINSKTKNKAEVIKAYKYIIEKMSERSYVAGYALPAWKVEIDPTKASKTVLAIDKLLNTADGFCPNWDTALDNATKTEFLKYTQNIFIGSMKAEDFGKRMQENMKKNRF